MFIQGGFSGKVDVASASTSWYHRTPAGMARLGTDALILAAGAAHIFATASSLHNCFGLRTHSVSRPMKQSLHLQVARVPAFQRTALNHRLVLQRKHAGISMAMKRHPPIIAQLVSFCLAVSHAAYIVVFVCRVTHESQLPHKLEPHHMIYNNLGGAAARVLLPFKRGAIPVLASDAINAAEVPQSSELPRCEGVGKTGIRATDGSLIAGGPLTEQPLWTLPDDNAGLDELATDLVCASLVPCSRSLKYRSTLLCSGVANCASQRLLFSSRLLRVSILLCM